MSELISVSVGVVLGFLLSEMAQLVRYRHRVFRLRVMVREELKSICAQIGQKKSILKQAQEELKKEKVMPTLAVHVLAEGYRTILNELYGHLSRKERNCLHVIYERLRVGDEFMDHFESKITAALKEHMVNDPYKYYTTVFGDLLCSYDVVKSLIGSYLKGDPIDVFPQEVAR